MSVEELQVDDQPVKDLEEQEPTPGGLLLTELVLTVFRTNAGLLAAGDRLMADQHMSVAESQVLAAIALGSRPLSIPEIAESMGMTRLAAHSTVGRLVVAGFVTSRPNDDAVGGSMVELTDSGREVYGKHRQRRTVWFNSLAECYPLEQLEQVIGALADLGARMETVA